MNRENAVHAFKETIKTSWTYERLTEEEIKRLEHCIDWAEQQNAIKGTYQQRFETLDAIYYTFLVALGYKNYKWRE